MRNLKHSSLQDYNGKVAFYLHEAEEWNILRWEQRNFVNLPAKTNVSVRTFLVVFTMFGFLWTALAALPTNPTIAAFVLLPFAAGAFLNALQHLFYTLYFRQYAPGVITSVVLYLPIVGYLTARVIEEHLVPVAYVVVLVLLTVLGLIHTIKAGNVLPLYVSSTSFYVGALPASSSVPRADTSRNTFFTRCVLDSSRLHCE